jgi:hypothetical protein
MTKVAVSMIAGLALATTIMFFFSALSASAATYAYVAANGEVKSVVADTWMAAIATAPGIHINSGVLLLKSAADFTIIGDDVSSI